MQGSCSQLKKQYLVATASHHNNWKEKEKRQILPAAQQPRLEGTIVQTSNFSPPTQTEKSLQKRRQISTDVTNMLPQWKAILAEVIRMRRKISLRCNLRCSSLSLWPQSVKTWTAAPLVATDGTGFHSWWHPESKRCSESRYHNLHHKHTPNWPNPPWH